MEVRFSTKMKFHTGLSSFRLSCEGTKIPQKEAIQWFQHIVRHQPMCKKCRGALAC